MTTHIRKQMNSITFRRSNVYIFFIINTEIVCEFYPLVVNYRIISKSDSMLLLSAAFRTTTSGRNWYAWIVIAANVERTCLKTERQPMEINRGVVLVLFHSNMQLNASIALLCSNNHSPNRMLWRQKNIVELCLWPTFIRRFVLMNILMGFMVFINRPFRLVQGIKLKLKLQFAWNWILENGQMDNACLLRNNVCSVRCSEWHLNITF